MRVVSPRARTFGNAAVTAGQQYKFLWSRESLLRLGLSLVLAIALWLYVTSKQNPTAAWDYSQGLPVATNARDGLIVTNNLPTVHVRIRVANNTTVTPASFHAYVDLSSIGPGPHANVPVQVVADPGIDVARITPSTVPVVIEKVETKAVPIRTSILSPPPDGYNAGSPQIDSTTARISGPQSIVSQVTQAVAYIYLSQMKSTLSSAYHLTPLNAQGDPPSNGSRLNVQPADVHVRVPIKPLSSYKTVPVLVSLTGQPRSGLGVLSMTVKPAAIAVRASPSRLSRLTTLSTDAVSVSRRGSGLFRSRVRLKLPSGIDSRIHWVTVSTRLGKVAISSSFAVRVTVINVLPGFFSTSQPANVVVTAVGSASSLRQASQNVTAVVDVSGYSTGTFPTRPVVTAGSGLKIISVYPRKIMVTLARSVGG